MTDPDKPRLVIDNGEPVPDDDDPLDYVPSPPPNKPVPHMQRANELFARVRLSWLTDRRWDCVFTPRARLFLLLIIESREGRRPVRLTNELARSISLKREAKHRHLREMELTGLITISRNSERSVPIISLIGRK